MDISCALGAENAKIAGEKSKNINILISCNPNYSLEKACSINSPTLQ
jgi:hypothetical protein